MEPPSYQEAARLQALYELRILDTPAEARFDAFTRTVQRCFEVPMVAISFLDHNRQWFKSHRGLDFCETEREVALCAHTILSDAILCIPDTYSDPRFADNPLVQNHPGIRCYVGAPLHDPHGYRVGTLCMMDTRPREFSPASLETLRDLADCVERELVRSPLENMTVDLKIASNALSAILDAVDDGIIGFHANGLIRSVNVAASKILGYSEKEMLKKMFCFFMPEHEQTRQIASLNQYLDMAIAPSSKPIWQQPEFLPAIPASGKPVVIEWVIKPIEDSVGGVWFVAIIRDISAKLASEQAGETPNKHAEETAEVPQIHIVLLDPSAETADFLRLILAPPLYVIRHATSLVEAQQALEKYKPDAILWHAESMHPDTPHALQWCAALKEQTETENIPFILMGPEDNNTLMAQGFAAGAVDYLKMPLVPAAVTGKLSAHIKIKKVMDAQAAEMIRANQLSALAEMVGTFAHEISGPVGNSTIAASFAQEMADGMQNSLDNNTIKKSELIQFMAQLRESLQIINHNLKRSHQLIQSFKRLAVDQCSQEKYEFHLKSLLEEIVFSLQPKLKKTKHTVHIQCPDELYLHSDPGALSQIFTNFIHNSLLHGFIPEQTGNMRIAAEIVGDVIALSYEDDGKGIPEEHLSKIFDRHFTTKRGAGGSGLGLNIVNQLVRNTLNGTLSVQSTVGKGTVFQIHLPAQIALTNTQWETL